MNRISALARGIALAGGAFLVLALGPGETQAQFSGWSPTFVLVGETAGDDVTLALAQVGMSPDGEGIHPVVSLQTYWLDHPGGSGWAFHPAAGLRYRASSGFLQGKVGYSWKSDESGDFPFFEGSSSGVSTSAQAEYWDGGAYGLSGIASYNWGSEYLWSRARGTVRVLQGTWGSLHPGAEIVWQGEMDDETVADPNYATTQYGGVLQWNSGNMLMMVLGGGVKQTDQDFVEAGGGDVDADTWYMKIEFVISP